MKRACFLVGLVLAAGLVWTAQGQVQAESVTLSIFSSTQPPETTEPPQKAIEFPCVLGNARLIVTDIVSFEGLTPESQQEIYVTDTLALLIYNPSKTGIVSATVTLTQGDKIWYFELSYLPAGSRVLVVERNHSAYEDGAFDSCQCEYFVKGDFATELPEVQITEENGNLSVKNLSDTPIPSLTVYYKAYTPYDDFYVGGRAMAVHFGFLRPGETATQKAYGYAKDYSRIAAVVIGK